MTGHDAIEAAIGQVGELLIGEIGLRPESSLRGRLRRSIRDEVSAHGGDLDGYVRSLSQDGERLQNLVNRVTVQESGFFRHPEHFDVLTEHVLPHVDQPVTIWSAGCANGQEAYSLAMLLEEQGIRGSIVATDLSTAALARTGRATVRDSGDLRGLADPSAPGTWLRTTTSGRSTAGCALASRRSGTTSSGAFPAMPARARWSSAATC